MSEQCEHAWVCDICGVAMDDERSEQDHSANVAIALRGLGVPCEWLHTGGGIWCVTVAEPNLPGYEWLFGMADVCWSGGLSHVERGEMYGDGTGNLQIVNTTVPSRTDVDAVRVARAIDAALHAWRETTNFALWREHTTREVVAQLRDLDATHEYPGYVAIPIVGSKGEVAAFGTVNEYWDGNVMDEGGGTDMSELGSNLGLALNVDIPSNSVDVTAIVAAIRECMARVNACYAGQHQYDSAENVDGGRCKTCGTPRPAGF